MLIVGGIGNRRHIEAAAWPMHVMIQQVTLDIRASPVIALAILNLLPDRRIIHWHCAGAAAAIGAQHFGFRHSAALFGGERSIGDYARWHSRPAKHDLK